MIANIVDYLEESSAKFPNKTAYADSFSEITFKDLKEKSKALASKIAEYKVSRRPVVVYMDKGINCIVSFLAVAYSGNFYTPIDYEMPIQRINNIMNTLQPFAIITDRTSLEAAKQIKSDAELIVFEDVLETSLVNEALLQTIRSKMIDTDPLYVLFTSGSTGTPKGVTICHRSVIDYIDWVSETFNITEEERFANQAPFYFDNSVLDIYCTLRNGSTMFIVPKQYFAFPIKLVEYLNKNEINIIFWVPSILCLVANLRTLQASIPQYLKKILFAGEVMPNKQLNIWRKSIPGALYANLYGPTEITVDCTYYIVDRDFKDNEPLPIGLPCRNTDILVLNEQNELVGVGEIGEICVRGTSLALGYYNNPEKTAEVFVQNPLNNSYTEIIYRSGDLAKYNDRGELLYVSRKDFQIKHMGHRIELGEIETAVSSLENINLCCCLYDSFSSKIILFYQGQADRSYITKNLKQILPKYMIPNTFKKLDELPLNNNGKIDRQKLKVLI
ncbi:amino acid adenylation domain-containing protein [Paenibacillus thiaminolyticus]|uniref:amino acid adenylation domain-containing protein n=1 Tax=Paenibacillus thiaminolyticus TaxID=49283 RepID=UPI0011620A52|nr:amino acid adenylation domain-containing protein [Paenibacillus thiaminolyticus]NGP60490.1 amino acid adenylation domain-containing protein [Paenibacillus thiaminolyticus]WCR25873.1 amino acid adenylation domain-containing protein [Paenibacillus thiaminolyticus]